MQEINILNEKIKTTTNASLEMSMGDVHVKGLFSLVFNGDQAGHLTRAYLASRKVKPFDAQLHSHTYDLKITVLKGRVTHHLARKLDVNERAETTIAAYKYKSPLNGGDGILVYSHEQAIAIEEYIIPPAATIHLKHSDIHTVSCSKGAIWVVEELGFRTTESTVLGAPFCHDGLYRKPEQFEINNNYQALRRRLRSLMNDHALSLAS